MLIRKNSHTSTGVALLPFVSWEQEHPVEVRMNEPYIGEISRSDSRVSKKEKKG